MSTKTKFDSYRFPPSVTIMEAHDSLISLVWKEVHVGNWLRVTQNCIDDFSRVTNDKQWIHVDVEWARTDSPFGTTIAHELLLLSLIPRLRGFDQKIEGYWGKSRLMVINDMTEAKFLTPVKANADIRSRTKLASVTANKRSLDIREEVSVQIKNRKQLAIVADLTLRAYLE